MRVVTWNVNSLKARMSRVEEWLGYAQPDVCCLQETKMADGAFPSMSFAALGYEAVHHGQGRWNGVAILSRVGISDVASGFSASSADPQEPAELRQVQDGEARTLAATCGGVRVRTVYVPNGRSLESEHYRAKLAWLGRLKRELAGEMAAGREPMIVCGDFNIAPTDADVWDATKLHGATHVSEAERRALAEVESLGLCDLFRYRRSEDRLYSWWDYRAGDFHQHRGMRIDLVLGSCALAEATAFAFIDRSARKGKLPSDHAPVMIDLDLDHRG